MLSCSFFNIWMWSNWSNFKFPRSKQVPMYHLDFKIFKNRVIYIYIYIFYIYILSVCIAIEWFLRLLVQFFLHNLYFRHIFLSISAIFSFTEQYFIFIDVCVYLNCSFLLLIWLLWSAYISMSLATVVASSDSIKHRDLVFALYHIM